MPEIKTRAKHFKKKKRYSGKAKTFRSKIEHTVREPGSQKKKKRVSYTVLPNFY